MFGAKISGGDARSYSRNLLNFFDCLILLPHTLKMLPKDKNQNFLTLAILASSELLTLSLKVCKLFLLNSELWFGSSEA